MNVLVADTAPLYPPSWGGPLRIYELYSNFFNSNITYVGIPLHVDKNFRGSHKKLKKHLKEIIVKPDKKYLDFKKLQLKFLKGLTFDLYTYLLMKFDKSFNKKIREESKDKHILISSHVWSFPCLKRNNSELLVYDSHNVEYKLMKQVTNGKFFGGIISYIVKRIEKNACKKSDLIVVCSDDDKKSLIELYGAEKDKIRIIPNSTDVKKFKVASKKEKEHHKKLLKVKGKTIFFVGAYYNPNIEALKFIVNKLAPKLKDYTFLIAGSVKNAFYEFSTEEKLPKNVRFFGQVIGDRLKNIIKASDIAINPTFTGSGIQIKMLDYMASGLPIVTTETGARGLGIENKKHAIICNTDKFKNEIRRLFKNKRLFQKLKNNARKKAFEFDSKKLGRKFEKILLSKVNKEAV